MDNSSAWRPDPVQPLLAQAGTNRQELVLALDLTPVADREGMQFLLENMPQCDLQSLSAVFLEENLSMAYEAFNQAPWKDQVPNDIFLNDVLPYACVTETRDAWRKTLRNLCIPIIAGCKTPGEAAQRINQKLFKQVKVHYSTARKRADQSPLESMQSGLASCTGLSVLLADACRSVGIPARLAGTPMWSDDRGNHTWVEVWDGGWHFVGAAEPDPKGLDHAWFEHYASLAVSNVPIHAIYATSFKKTGVIFPLDWAPDIHWINAVNVTLRYATNPVVAAPETARLLVKVVEPTGGRRVAAKVSVSNLTNSADHFDGISRDDSADMNNLLSFELKPGGRYQVRAELNGRIGTRKFAATNAAQQLVVLTLGELPPIKPRALTKLGKSLGDYFAAPPEKQAGWKFSGSLEKLLMDNEPAVRDAAWQAYKAAPVHAAFKKDFDEKHVTFENYLSPYTVKFVGDRPPGGWALFIAMHGGGGTAKDVNDDQWKIMQSHYRDHPEAGGYIYLALRAPNDTWNGFYDVYVYPLIANLVHEFLLFGDVDPDKVFIMGYSHGGYGAFAIGPKEPDLFAAIHASAGAPTDGETTAKTLRNTVFTCMVGEQDTMYNRLGRDKKFRDEIAQLRGDRTDIYPVEVDIALGAAHSNLADRDEIKDMYPAVRNPVPRELTWLMTDKVITDFFWLHADTPDKKKEIDATCRDNHLTVTAAHGIAAAVLLDSRLVDFKKPVLLELNGQAVSYNLKPSLKTLCETLQRRCDPKLAFTAEIVLPPETISARK